jgi:hypothetical protein
MANIFNSFVNFAIETAQKIQEAIYPGDGTVFCSQLSVVLALFLAIFSKHFPEGVCHLTKRTLVFNSLNNGGHNIFA